MHSDRKTGRSEINIPPGLRDMLLDLTAHILRTQPEDLYQSAIDFLTMKKSQQQSNSSASTTDDKAKKHGDDDEAEPMPPPPRRVTRRAAVADESYDPEKANENVVKVVHPKSDEQIERLKVATKNIILFRNLEDDHMKEIIDAMFEHKVKAGDTVIKMGDDGDNFYVIESGFYDIIVKVDGVEKCVGNYDNNGSFGELALMYNAPRAATIVAKTDGILWAMTRDMFRQLVKNKAFEKRNRYQKLLEGVSILNSLSLYDRMNVADALKTRIFADGEIIIKQGEPGAEMFFIEEGTVRITVQSGDAGSEAKEVSVLHHGDYFGELALLTTKPRAASARADGKVKLAVLDVESFERLLGSCTDLLKRNIDNYEAKLCEIFGNLDNVPELRK